MNIPIIVSRKKSNGQIEHINIQDQKSLLPLQRTFNPYAFNCENQQLAQQKNQPLQQHLNDDLHNFQPRKLSKTRPRRISSSGVSKRFPRDFFKMEQQKDSRKGKRTFQTLNPLRLQNSLCKRPQSMLSIYGKRQIAQNVQTPKFQKVKQNNPTIDSLNLKSQLEEYCFSNCKGKDQDNINKIKIKPFKIKNTTSRKFISNMKNSLNQTKRKNELLSDKQNKVLEPKAQNKKKQKNKTVNINGKKVNLEKDEKGGIRIKLLGIY